MSKSVGTCKTDRVQGSTWNGVRQRDLSRQDDQALEKFPEMVLGKKVVVMILDFHMPKKAGANLTCLSLSGLPLASGPRDQPPPLLHAQALANP